MPLQHNLRSQAEPRPQHATPPQQSIQVPLGLPGFQILSQAVTEKGEREKLTFP